MMKYLHSMHYTLCSNSGITEEKREYVIGVHKRAQVGNE
jgi:hypothetical protein